MKKCQEWLQKNHKDLYETIWSPGTRNPGLPFPAPHIIVPNPSQPPNSQKP